MAIKFVDTEDKRPCKSKKPPAEIKKRAPKGSFDRTAYQRELMRKKRAKEKSKA